jgi:hypothetical protein
MVVKHETIQVKKSNQEVKKAAKVGSQVTLVVQGSKEKLVEAG